MKKEVWKDIPNYEGLYQVSNLGRVKSLDRNVISSDGRKMELIGKYLKQVKRSDGYNQVYLSKCGKVNSRLTHIILAITFLNHTPSRCKIVVDHIDNNPSNNELSNLQLITHRENLSKDKKNKTSKYVGVYWNKASKKWKSQIRIDGKLIHIGVYDNEKEAGNAYKNKLTKVSQKK